ncbi:MAG: sigma 54-interacting transcriptional regulator [Burkholderiaceae bacterium]|nr:sigma 54-interacting transcriptional regulator [Burkholderiaceae bacterium]
MAADSKPSCEQIIDIMVDPFVVIDRDYRIVAANRAYRERYGVEPGGVVGRLCHEVSHHSEVPCSRNGEHCPLEEVFERKQATQVMHVHFDRDGGEEYVQLHSSPLLGDDGEVRYIGETIFRVASAQGDDAARLIGRSQPLLRMTSLLQRVAPTQTTVLLLGESGVGKEQVAKYLHHYSNRAHGPFVVVDCAALGANLIESELFGHEKGSFTGASQRTRGLFEAADGGTLFIDEIGELPLGLQPKLLRVLEDGSFRRVGSHQERRVDVRLIAATNRDLAEEVSEGRFREDLYYRINVMSLVLPPLRERGNDVNLLIDHFLGSDWEIEDDARMALAAYRWPGNVRQLVNALERATILADERLITLDDLPHEVVESPPQEKSRIDTTDVKRLDLIERAHIIEVLRQERGNKARAARSLGIHRRKLYRLMERFEIGEDAYH